MPLCLINVAQIFLNVLGQLSLPNLLLMLSLSTLYVTGFEFSSRSSM
jgi:hypothetical protein